MTSDQLQELVWRINTIGNRIRGTAQTIHDDRLALRRAAAIVLAVQQHMPQRCVRCHQPPESVLHDTESTNIEIHQAAHTYRSFWDVVNDAFKLLAK